MAISMDRRSFVLSSMGVVATGALAAAESPSLRSMLVGVWSLTEAVTIRGSETAPWFGRRPPITGNLIYTENGWMSVHISGAPQGTISRADFLKLPAAERAAWLDQYYAYYGTFDIDESARVVTHHIVSSLLPYETTAILKRDASIEGNTLTLLTPPRDEGGGKTFNRLVWVKTA